MPPQTVPISTLAVLKISKTNEKQIDNVYAYPLIICITHTAISKVHHQKEKISQLKSVWI